MKAMKRRELIMNLLREHKQAISASSLAEKCEGSRQLIVGDIALLRAAGERIIATPRGYILERASNELECVIAVLHKQEQLQDELKTIVAHGGSIIDVIVEHPLYGELRGNLHIHSQYDIDQFIKRCEQTKAQPLSTLTNGVHLHTIRFRDELSYQRTLSILKEKKYLYEEGE